MSVVSPIDTEGQPSDSSAEALERPPEEVKGDQPSPSGEDLNAARMATLASTPATQEAHALVARVVDLITGYEKTTGGRKRTRRARDQESLSRAVAAFLGDLLARAPQDGQGALVHRSTRSNTFSSGPVGFRPFMAITSALVALRFVQQFPGYYLPREFDWGNGMASGRGRSARFRATPVLLGLAAEHGIAPGETRDHFRQPPPERVIVLKEKSRRAGRHKIKGGDLPVPNTAVVRRLAEQVQAINAFLEDVKITGGSHGAFVRGFEHGDQKGFLWNKGGRLYSSGDYQNLKENCRLAMRLDGEPVVEIDIKASYLTILHGKLGIVPEFGADPYAVPGIPREVVKGWLVATLGAGKHLQRWPSDQAAAYATKRGGRQLGRDHPVSVVWEQMLARYPVLEHVGKPGLGWADLMFAESEAIIGTMLVLIRQGTPSLPVHDSLIVPAHAEGLAVDALNRNVFSHP